MYRRRLLKSLTALAVLGVTGVSILLALLWLEHDTEITLPHPTGQFEVGRTMYDWVDDARTDSLAPVPGKKRELVVWIWYPSAPERSAKAAEYLPALWRTVGERSQGVLMSKFFTRDLSLVRAHSVLDTDVSPAQRSYPIVIMKSGIGALATDYTTLAEDLASHGYIVVGSDAPYSTSAVVFPDGRVAKRTPAGNPPENLPAKEQDRLLNRLVAVWSRDACFVLDQLERLNDTDPSGKFRGRLDLQSVGVFGHSFGGATAAQFCHDDYRCKAGIDIDGTPYGSVILEGLKQPFMFILSDHGKMSDPVSRQILGNIQSIYDHLPNGRLRITIRGARHFNFSDQALLKDRYLSRMLGALGPIGVRRGLQVTATYVLAFFDTHLKNTLVTLVNGPSPQYPDVQFEAR